MGTEALNITNILLALIAACNVAMILTLWRIQQNTKPENRKADK